MQSMTRTYLSSCQEYPLSPTYKVPHVHKLMKAARKNLRTARIDEGYTARTANHVALNARTFFLEPNTSNEDIMARVSFLPICFRFDALRTA